MIDEKPRRVVVSSFEGESVVIPLEQLVGLKTLRPGAKQSQKYAQILTSVRTVGLVEAPVVTPNPTQRGKYFILDGHLRVEVIKDLGISEVECLIATDDEPRSIARWIMRCSWMGASRLTRLLYV